MRVVKVHNGIIQPGDAEYEAHRKLCPVCQWDDGFLPADSTAYRPHTFDENCWCTKWMRFAPKRCWLEKEGYLSRIPLRLSNRVQHKELNKVCRRVHYACSQIPNIGATK